MAPQGESYADRVKAGLRLRDCCIGHAADELKFLNHNSQSTGSGGRDLTLNHRNLRIQ